MRWKWTAASVVLIVGSCLLVTNYYLWSDESNADGGSFPHRKNQLPQSAFSKSHFIDEDDATLVRPKLIKSRSKRGSYIDDNGVALASKSNISITLSQRLLYKLTTTQDSYLYSMNIFGDEVLVNLSRVHFGGDHNVFAPNFILQHLDTNYTWIANNSSKGVADNHCLYTGRIIDNATMSSQEETFGSILLNLCQGMYGVLELPQGTYFLEPLQNASNVVVPDDQPHLLYRHRSHTFHDYATSRNVYSNVNQRIVAESSSKNNESTSGFRTNRSRRPRATTSHEHYVEVLVVADAQMRQYHRDNLENYILTLLSIVATIYRHPSLEAALNIVVVRLIVLDHENAGPKITVNAQDTLKQFCHWQQTLNDDDDSSINHHDVAILLTRRDICRAPGKCDTLGLAELGTMCDSYRSCAIIEDNGLSAAFTIAHELGHIFNIPHDDEKKCSQYMSLEKFNFHIMAPTLEYNTHPWSWSPCSSSLLRDFLETEKSDCLFDKPVQQTYSQQMVTNPAPGLNFSVHQQCQYVFGPAAEICPFMPACKRLWCTNVYSYQIQAGCRTQHMPWADGTPCGYSKWCYRGECVALPPDQLTVTDGQWGVWKDWGDCSRTCGSGVEKSVRNCDDPNPSNGGKYCVGERVRYRSCSNLKECPEDTPDFREIQCSEFNGKRHTVPNVSPDVKWVPRYNGLSPNDRCKLYCTIDGGSDFYMLKSKVVDGTTCGRDTDNICVDGVCREAGCDGKLGSTLKRDECGVCAGDGKSCVKEVGAFNEQTTYGYNSVIKIPSGANNLDIRQTSWNNRSDDDNYLALLNSKGEFILNGHFQVTVFHQEIRVRGAVLEYSGSDTTIERVNSSKPIHEDLFLHVLSVGQLKPPIVNWEYMTVDKAQAAYSTSRLSYEWRPSDKWSTCDKACHGSQLEILICIETSDGQQVSEQNCENIRKPDVHQRVCNIHCQLKWATEILSECSTVCGSGIVTQKTFCAEFYNNDQFTSTNDSYCDPVHRPPNTVACFKDCAGRRWVYTDWDQCSQSCGGGVQRRAAMCHDQKGYVIDVQFCENLLPDPTEQACNVVPCPKWFLHEWSQCSQTCDGGIQVRSIACRDANDNDIDVRLCDDHQRPHGQRKCNEHYCISWKFDTWSECSQTCGDGIARRNAKCVDSKGNVVGDEKCMPSHKILTKPCKLATCSRWRLGEWSPCSRTCLDGWSSRRVDCVGEGDQIVDDKFCDNSEEVPPAHKQCSHGQCPFWRVQDWSTCSVSCGNGVQERGVDCVYKDDVVDASYCNDLAEPPKRQTCAAVKCPIWQTGDWETCPVTCGVGTVRRMVLCIFPEAKVHAGDELCDQSSKPSSTKECKIAECPPSTQPSEKLSTHLTPSTILPYKSSTTLKPSSTLSSIYHVYNDPFTTVARYSVSKHSTAYVTSSQTSPTRWEMGSWSECSVTCGEGEQLRYVACLDIFHRILPDIYCGHDVKPDVAKRCVRNTCGDWHVGDWHPCPATCGEGFKSVRPITCVAPTSENVLEWSYCDPDKRPVSERDCSLPLCSSEMISNDIENQFAQSSWRVGDWGQCSQTCGGGWQQRLVLCVPGVGYGPIVYCLSSEKPVALRQCAQRECPRWMFGDWGQCNRSCDVGYQERIVECVDPENGQILSWNNCTAPSPERWQMCNKHKCQTHGTWRIGKWAPCSVVCGRTAARIKNARCMDLTNSSSDESDSICVGQRKLFEQKICRLTRCPRWNKSRWSACSVSCGEGIRSREVQCTQGRKNVVSNKKCGNLTKPQDTIHCRLPACPTYHWTSTRWTVCSQHCGAGKQFRQIYCVNNLRQKSPPGACNSQQRPPAIQNCVGQRCPYFWVPGPWTACSRTCGEGEQFRNLHCQIKPNFANVSEVGGNGIRVPDTYCNMLPKPATRWHCTLSSCEADTFWIPEEWSSCSVTCGWGTQQRKVHCSDRNSVRIQRIHCANISSEYRPRRKRRCFVRNCDPTSCVEVKEKFNFTADGLFDVIVGGRPIKVFCFGMDTATPFEYLPLPAGLQTNFAEIYGKRLLQPFTCPFSGNRSDNCQCTDKGHSNPGLTRFSRVRIDLYHMKINIMDNRFAVSESGQFVQYASAGDCYSAANCPQGRFSVDLRGTGFKVADKTFWKEEGYRVTSEISRLNNGSVVQGKCGGYCGTCYPDKKRGLEVAIDPEQF